MIMENGIERTRAILPSRIIPRLSLSLSLSLCNRRRTKQPPEFARKVERKPADARSAGFLQRIPALFRGSRVRTRVVHPGKEKERRIGKIAHVANRKREIDSRLSLHGRARETRAAAERRQRREGKNSAVTREMQRLNASMTRAGGTERDSARAS